MTTSTFKRLMQLNGCKVKIDRDKVQVLYPSLYSNYSLYDGEHPIYLPLVTIEDGYITYSSIHPISNIIKNICESYVNDSFNYQIGKKYGNKIQELLYVKHWAIKNANCYTGLINPKVSIKLNSLLNFISKTIKDLGEKSGKTE